MPSLLEQQTAIEQRQQAAELKPSVIAAQTLSAVAVMVLIGALAVWAGEPWLGAALGSSVLLQTLEPDQKTATMWDTCVGQIIGLVAGFAGVYAVGADSVPAFTNGEPLVWARVAAVAVAFVLLVPIQQVLKAKHSPGGSMALLVTLGLEPPTWHALWVVIMGIIMVTVFGEGARLLVTRVAHGPEAAKEMLSKKP